jgi:heat shock protein HslJ
MILRVLTVTLGCWGLLNLGALAQQGDPLTEGPTVPDRGSVATGAVPYRAGGNEPFWSVTLTGGDVILSRPGAADVTLRLRDTGLTDAGDIVLRAGGAAGADRVTVVRRAELCRDSMTGMPHPETVVLTVENDTYTGCGGDPRDLLTGGTWQVQRIDGREVLDSADATLTFGREGAYHGSGSCNRYRGQYELTGEGLSFGAAAGTMMACAEHIMAQERRFLDALPAVTRFDLTDAGALVLLEGDTARVVATPMR